jgi:hypothetical protein
MLANFSPHIETVAVPFEDTHQGKRRALYRLSNHLSTGNKHAVGILIAFPLSGSGRHGEHETIYLYQAKLRL